MFRRKNVSTLNLNPGADCISRAELGVIPKDMHSHNSAFYPKNGTGNVTKNIISVPGKKRAWYPTTHKNLLTLETRTECITVTMIQRNITHASYKLNSTIRRTRLPTPPHPFAARLINNLQTTPIVYSALKTS